MSDNTSFSDSFTRCLAYYLAMSGKSKKEVADAIGVPPTTFSSWTKGRHQPDMDKLQKLSDYLGAPISQFFNYELEPPPDPYLQGIIDTVKQLSTEDKALVKAVADRLLKLNQGITQ